MAKQWNYHIHDIDNNNDKKENPTPRIALSVRSLVGLSVTKFQPHHRNMHHTYMHASGSGTRIVDVLGMHHTSQNFSRIIHALCIMDTYYTHMGLEGVRNRKKHPSFLLMPNSHKLRKDSKNVNFKIGS